MIFTDMRNGYVELGHYLIAHGRESAPRGETTLEVLGCSFTLEDPMRAWPHDVGRKPVAALAAVEALQLIGQIHDPKTLVKASPPFAEFLDENGVLRAAYGSRISDRLKYAVSALQRDPDSRRAIVALWQDTDHYNGFNDYPCTVALQFFIREGRLEMVTFMRSNDFWRGLPYDVFMFTRLQCVIADVVKVKVGPYHHYAGSMHVYEQHVPLIANLQVNLDVETLSLESVLGIGGLATARERARLLHRGETLAYETSGETWMREKMHA